MNFIRIDLCVCLDACFTQKRRNPLRGPSWGPPNMHPESAFLSEAEIQEMKEHVESI
ncbi:hypothetical protein BDQ12DRAFT_619859, partial [Crucibulum laeve]